MQSTQKTKDYSTDLNFTVYSPLSHRSEQLILYAEGPCRDARRSQSRVAIHFKPCGCQFGFQSKDTANSCECVCNSKLEPYVRYCNYTTTSLIRDSNAWISLINDSDWVDSKGRSSSDCHCCLLPYPNVQINLNIVNVEVMHSVLTNVLEHCGNCRPGVRLSLGSSRCCSTSWHCSNILTDGTQRLLLEYSMG